MSMTKDRPPADAWGDDEPGAYWRSPRTFAAAAVLACIAAAAVWTVATGGQQEKAGPAGYASACGLVGGSTAEPSTAPQVQWQNLDGDWLPVSTTHGPGRRTATGPWTCYSHTPTGAVLAAWSIPQRLNSVDDFPRAVKQQTLPGAGQTALLTQGLGGFTPVDERPLPTGFKVNYYDGSTATITLYGRQRGAEYGCASNVQWVGGDSGDWKLRVNPEGRSLGGCQQVAPTNLRDRAVVAWGPTS